MNDNEIIKTLHALKHDSLLEDDFNSVVRLIGKLRTSTARAKVGKLLHDSGPVSGMCSSLQSVKLAILSSCNVDELQHLARTAFFERKMCSDVYLSDFNQYYFQLIDTESALYRFDANIVVVVLDEDVVFSELASPWTVEDLTHCIDAFSCRFQQIVELFQKTSNAYLVIPTIPLSFKKYGHLLGYKEKAKLSLMWNNLNATILQASLDHQQIITFDTNILLQKIAKKDAGDIRLSYYAGMNFHVELLDEIAKELACIASTSIGNIKKVLVVDLDDTLWGGIAGEDGLNGIDLGASPEGKAYVDLQHYLKQLASQGVLLAINSKNDPECIADIFSNHPDMFLKQKDFLVKKINWNPKSENMKDIAVALNVGTDSLVFMDDSSHECHLVAELVPEVAVLHIEEPPFSSIEKIQDSRLFNTIEVTVQDTQRSESYAAEIEKRTFLESHASIDDYLSALQIKVKLFVPDSLTLPRIAQLHARTNQFNMTTQRYTEKQLIEFQNSDFLVLGINVSDRFGDSGVVGSIVLERQGGEAGNLVTIKNFLLSCRFFSRRIEVIALEEIKSTLKQMGIAMLYAEYIPTKKNINVKNFYIDNGFYKVSDNEVQLFACDLNDSVSTKTKNEFDWIKDQF